MILDEDGVPGRSTGRWHGRLPGGAIAVTTRSVKIPDEDPQAADVVSAILGGCLDSGSWLSVTRRGILAR